MDGHLHIKAQREAFGSRHYTSARLATKGKADWRYGRIEVRLRPPVGRGTWAAVWMLPSSSKYGDWPRCGEIDIMEHVGLDPGKVHGTIHTEMCNHKKGTQVGNILDAGLGEWHTYGVAWSHDRLNFFYDGQRYLTVTKAHLLGLPDAFSFPFTVTILTQASLDTRRSGQVRTHGPSTRVSTLFCASDVLDSKLPLTLA